ncbi:hypothetical protein LBMAG25_00500 [Bacteroidota bacterium]|nr:hypothetical protein LBMAG25_00500 [Bacteroidota bacterium]
MVVLKPILLRSETNFTLNRSIKKVLGYFLRGLLFVSPIFLTVYAIYVIIQFFDNLIPGLYPGLSIILVIMGITIIGYFSYNILMQSLLNLIEGVILKTPGLKIIYSSVKDLLSALVGNKKTFNQPVMILMSKESGIHKLGFITKDDLTEVGVHNLVAVYCPHSYNFSGNLFLVPRENITPLPEFKSSDAMKFIVSGGVTDLISRGEDKEEK